jgi:hypothetical protein
LRCLWKKHEAFWPKHPPFLTRSRENHFGRRNAIMKEYLRVSRVKDFSESNVEKHSKTKTLRAISQLVRDSKFAKKEVQNELLMLETIEWHQNSDRTRVSREYTSVELTGEHLFSLP